MIQYADLRDSSQIPSSLAFKGEPFLDEIEQMIFMSCEGISQRFLSGRARQHLTYRRLHEADTLARPLNKQFGMMD